MIRGKYLTSRDDLLTVLDLRMRVFVEEQGFSKENERDAHDDMAVYALVYTEKDEPVGTGRLYIDLDRFVIGRICVLRAHRGRGFGDLIMRMLLSRALELNAPSVHLTAQLEKVPFYEKYGFKPFGDLVDDEGVPHQPMRAMADEIDIDGDCCAG